MTSTRIGVGFVGSGQVAVSSDRDPGTLRSWWRCPRVGSGRALFTAPWLRPGQTSLLSGVDVAIVGRRRPEAQTRPADDLGSMEADNDPMTAPRVLEARRGRLRRRRLAHRSICGTLRGRRRGRQQLDRCSVKRRPSGVKVAPDRRSARSDERLGVDAGADLHGEGAPGPETATCRPTDRFTDFAGEDDAGPFAPAGRVRDRDGGQERRRVRVGGPQIDLVRLPFLDDLPEVHHGDPIADVANDREIVSDEQVCQSQLVLELAEEVDDLRLG